MAKAEQVIISAQIPKTTRIELERRAQDNYRSLSAELRMAVDAHLQREQFRAEAAAVRARLQPIVVDDPKENS